MIAILDILDVLLNWKTVSATKRSSRKVRRIRRTGRGFVVDYIW